MTKEELLALPPALAVEIVIELLLAMPGSEPLRLALAETKKPFVPQSPKYDAIIYRKDGVQYASEMDVGGLQFWHRLAVESAEGGGEYAEKDAKRAKALSFWIAWRKCNPGVPWAGERNRKHVIAAAPSSKPEVYPREYGVEKKARDPGGYTPNFDDDPGAGDDDIPF